jgi:hypothetical protein
MFVAVTFALLVGWDQVAFQPSAIRWPDGNVNANVQLLTVAVPVLVMVTPAVKPLPPPQFSAR